MGTRKSYKSWSFGENWEEIWSYYEFGDGFETWIKKNIGWIEAGFIQLGMKDQVKLEDLENLYRLIKDEDWQSNSCGGCI